jgi:hypothetical protein
MSTTKRPGGFAYVVAALNMKTDRRPATKLVLVILANHRNQKTGLCCPSYKRLMDLTGYSRRTLTYELKQLRDAGLISWKRGWGNEYSAGVPNRYTLNLKAMKALAYEDDDVRAPNAHAKNDACAVYDDACAVKPDACAMDGGSMCNQETLTSKHSNLQYLKPPTLEPPSGGLGSQPEKLDPKNAEKTAVENTEAETGEPRQVEASANLAHASFGPGPVTPAHMVDPFPALDYDPNYDRNKPWGCSRNIGRGATSEEINEIKRRNRLDLRPEDVLVQREAVAV